MKKLLIFAVFLCFLGAKDVLILTTSMGKTSQDSKFFAFKKIAKDINLSVDYYFDSDINSTEKPSLLKGYKLIVFDSLAGAGSMKELMGSFANELNALEKNVIIVPVRNKDLKDSQNIDQNSSTLFSGYWLNGGRTNLQNLAKFIKHNLILKQDLALDPPYVFPKEGIYHPRAKNLVFKSLDEYLSFVNPPKNARFIGVGFHRGSLSSDTTLQVDYVINALEKQGIVPIAFFTDVSGNDSAGVQFLSKNNKTLVDAIITFALMIIDHEPLKEVYAKLNVPILHALYFSGSKEKWQETKQGVSFSMIPMTYIIPETIGFTDPLIVSAQKNHILTPIKPQIDSIINKAINISKLKHKANADKKIAIMFYNYPAGVKNIGASNLNIPRSLEKVFLSLKDNNYTVSDKNESFFTDTVTGTLQVMYDVNFYPNANFMLKNDLAALYPLSKYLKAFYKLPVSERTEMIRVWGYPITSKMLYYKNNEWFFLVPRVKIGNVVVMPQPRRGEREDSIRQKNLDISRDDSRLWHNPNVPMNHAYFAAYLYVRESFKADALVHFGTHGTQEWMAGKERGLSVYDNAYAVLGDLPVIYPYITNNLAEGIQAKRRGRATLISHQTPPFGISGTYEELGKLMDLINEYSASEDGMLKEKVKTQILDLSIKQNIHKDMDKNTSAIKADFEGFVSELQDYILSLGKQAQPLGMHTFGTYPKEEHLITTIINMLGKDYIKAAQNGDELFGKDYKDINKSASYTLIKTYVIQNEDLSKAPPKTRAFLELGKTYAKSFKDTKEIKNFLRALNGEYIETGIGGDSIRNPQSLPTGNNMYGFDPSKVPTKAAWETGKKLMSDFLANHYKENGAYPRKLAFNLWSLETMRHFGVLEAQILYAMGVEPIWNENGISDKHIQNMAKMMLDKFLPNFLSSFISSLLTLPRVEFILDLLPEKMSAMPKKMIRHAKKTAKGQIEGVRIIPYKDLKRPRIDVVISATGLYRDTFPNVMKLLSKAVKDVAKLKEDNNFLRQNSLLLQKELAKNKDINESEAQYLSTIRVFSNKPGSYGSGVDEIDETGRWENNKRIAQNYRQTLGYYYGADENNWGSKNVKLDLYGKVLSGTEGLIFSRSSNLYGLLTSDDPFEYFGSMAMAIKDLDGKAPKSYISNLRDPKDAKLESTAKFMAKELRTRYFHPKWIQEMKAQGNSGAGAMLDVMNNFWGWQVVDPNIIRNDQWQEFADIYIKDKYNLKLEEWFKSINPDALARFVEKILEANRKGYFETDEETLKKLIETYKDLQVNFNAKTYNQKFKDYVNEKAIGFGLMLNNSKLAPKAAMPNAQKPQENKSLKGQELKEQKVDLDSKNEQYLAIIGLLIIIALGAFRELRRKI